MKECLKELCIPATLDQLIIVLDSINQLYQEFGFPEKSRMEVTIAAEEIFANIAQYAYDSQGGPVTIRCLVSDDPLHSTVEFIDNGKPFNPLTKIETDITLPANQREVGGLGIYIIKKCIDSIEYRYENNKNILTIKKHPQIPIYV